MKLTKIDTQFKLHNYQSLFIVSIYIVMYMMKQTTTTSIETTATTQSSNKPNKRQVRFITITNVVIILFFKQKQKKINFCFFFSSSFEQMPSSLRLFFFLLPFLLFVQNFMFSCDYYQFCFSIHSTRPFSFSFLSIHSIKKIREEVCIYKCLVFLNSRIKGSMKYFFGQHFIRYYILDVPFYICTSKLI